MVSNGGKKAGRAAGHGDLIKGLIRRIKRPAPAPAPAPREDGDDSAQGELPPAGRRSGRGADSIEPFLEHSRNSRPGPLE
jgi:hypothetical protein